MASKPDSTLLYRADLSAQEAAFHGELLAAIQRVLRSGRYVLGPEGERFEREFARYLGIAEAIGVGSGTDALILALESIGLEPGDEVITTPFTAIPTVSAIVRAGATPRFVDIDSRTLLMRVDLIEAAVGPRTKAIMPVHIFGAVVPMSDVLEIARSRGLAVIEDAAQAHGSSSRGRRAGTFGDLGCFSFYPTKNLGGYGDGGMIVTDNPARAAELRRRRNYGKTHADYSVSDGVNTRLDELQAAMLSVKLPHLDEMNARRAAAAVRYRDGLAGTPIEFLEVPDGCVSNHHVLTVRVPERRDALRAHLESAGVQSTVFYPVPLYDQEAFRRFRAPGGEPCPETARACRQVLSIPLFPEMHTSDIDRVVAAIREFFHAGRRA
jgi:dTDP-3-amino-2,3,6-trideoxy-4-keto-D-glucose/dTDP-3-amino-3,4,6-trideoxy-alpha-D-glucose/dTDP-2,6-dideoxy-D-kanosamine transaminase